MRRRLVLLGPPGAGKGTQAKLLADALHIPHVSTGDILRGAVSNGSPLGKEARRYMTAGQLVPDSVMVGLVEERLDAPDAKAGFILDGYPRTVTQADALDASLVRRGTPLDTVVQIAVPRDELVRRLAGRRVCSTCGAMFHVVFSPSAVEGRCDACGGTLLQREDDSEETVARRMEVYERETAPLVERYRRAGVLRTIDGTGTREDILVRIRGALA